MYFNENKENTNIDEEFKSKKTVDLSNLSNFKKPLIIIGAILLFIIIIAIIVSLTKNKTKYYVSLEGNEEIILYKGSSYNDPGYSGYDNKGRTYDVEVSGEVDTSKVGIYTITYTLHNVKKTRTVKVMETPENPTIIHLNGSKNITIKVGEKYEEPGYSAVDYAEGNLTSKVKVSGSVDTSKKGVYRLVYSVVNSDGVTTSEARVITVE